MGARTGNETVEKQLGVPQVEDLKALRDLLLYHVEDLEDIMAALKSRHDFASCTLWRLSHPVCAH